MVPILVLRHTVSIDHPMTPCHPHFHRCPGFSCMTTFVPGGTIGVALKSNAPSNCAYTGSFGLMRDAHMRFNVVSTCISIRHNGKLGSTGLSTSVLQWNHSWMF